MVVIPFFYALLHLLFVCFGIWFRFSIFQGFRFFFKLYGFLFCVA